MSPFPFLMSAPPGSADGLASDAFPTDMKPSCGCLDGLAASDACACKGCLEVSNAS